MSTYSFDFIFNELDFPEFAVVSLIISGISKILNYQLVSELGDSWVSSGNEVSLYFYSGESSKALRPFNALPVLSNNSTSGEITLQEQSELYNDEYFIRKEFDAHQFKDLALASVDVDDGVPFALPVYDIRKIPTARIQEVRNVILDLYYEGLKSFAGLIGADSSKLKEAYQKTKSKTWFIEKSIDDIVLSRGKKPSKAQLIARWEPDYIYHSARIFEEDGSTRDILFMIYWRLLGIQFFNDPGKLSWVNKDKLKFIPKSRDDYRFVFDVNKGQIDFSYYFEPPRYRASKFYSHLVEDDETTERNTLYLN